MSLVDVRVNNLTVKHDQKADKSILVTYYFSATTLDIDE